MKTIFLLFCPADHIMEPPENFKIAVQDVAQHYSSTLVTFGIKPKKAETGYGYLECEGKKPGALDNVVRFIEKPDMMHAAEFIKDGRYLWNAGIFMFSIGVILAEFERSFPELHKLLKEENYDRFLAQFTTLPSISIDFAVMEKSKNIQCWKLDVSWNDVGSWEALYQALPKDENQNVTQGDIFVKDVKNSLVIGNDRLIALHGLQDLIVVDTSDAVLIMDKKNTQDVRALVGDLKKKKRREVDECNTLYRPWGQYTILEQSERYKIKKITVNVKGSLSLQKHFHRSEHWIVVKGTALVQIGDKTVNVHENESIYVPKSVPHRLSNPGKIPLEIIEVQNGEYLCEDDIERIEDDYDRI